MTEAFWWYLLAGFLVGFTLSTIWEWLHFRRKRMRIENRRIAELEAMLRSYTIAEESQPVAAGPRDSWVAPSFDDPGAYLDIEDAAAVSANPPADRPPVSYPGAAKAQVIGERGTVMPAPPPVSPEETERSGTAAATIATAGAVASAITANREESPASPEAVASPPQTNAPRSGAFPTAAAQVTSAPANTRHAIPKGMASHDTLTEPSSAAFPSAAAQPAQSPAPLALATIPPAEAGRSAPAPSSTTPVDPSDEEDRITAAALAAGAIAAGVAAQQATAHAEEEAGEEAATAEHSDDHATPKPQTGGFSQSENTVGQPDQIIGASPEPTTAVPADPLPETFPASSDREVDRHPGRVAAATTAAVIAKDRLGKHQASDADQPFANGYHSETAPDSDAAQTEPITPAKIDALVASIHELIDAVNQDRAENAVEITTLAAVAGQLQESAPISLAAAPRSTVSDLTPEAAPSPDGEPTNRLEEALVLLVRSISRFFRQLRVILSGEGAQMPRLQQRVAGADLLRIDGMKQQAVDRLRIAGITSPAELARLSEAELRMLLISPGDESSSPDYSAWLAQAAELAASEKSVAR